MLPIEDIEITYEMTREDFENFSDDISVKGLKEAKIGDLRKSHIIYDDKYGVVFEVIEREDESNITLAARYVKFIEKVLEDPSP